MKRYDRLLDGVCAVVSSAGDVCGNEIVKKLALQGASVGYGVSDRAIGESILSEIKSISPCSFYQVTDLADSKAVESFCVCVKRRFPFTAVLVNHPYADWLPGIAQYHEEQVIRQLQVTQRSVMQTMRAFFGPMIENRNGSIINISSNAVYKTYLSRPFMTLSMGTIGGLTRAAACEGGEYNVRVNELLSGVRAGHRTLLQQQQPDASDASSVADVVLFLASEMSSYITGASITVDGGASRQLHG
ncbi:MAG: SDR family oxidoreductase [Ruminococcaceae bacterium]|nr:SDR family oxidoreductase [Oscillospiraceae bacterium]